MRWLRVDRARRKPPRHSGLHCAPRTAGHATTPARPALGRTGAARGCRGRGRAPGGARPGSAAASPPRSTKLSRVSGSRPRRTRPTRSANCDAPNAPPRKSSPPRVTSARRCASSPILHSVPRYRLVVETGRQTTVGSVDIRFRGPLAEPAFAERAASLKSEWSLPGRSPVSQRRVGGGQEPAAAGGDGARLRGRDAGRVKRRSRRRARHGGADGRSRQRTRLSRRPAEDRRPAAPRCGAGRALQPVQAGRSVRSGPDAPVPAGTAGNRLLQQRRRDARPGVGHRGRSAAEGAAARSADSADSRPESASRPTRAPTSKRCIARPSPLGGPTCCSPASASIRPASLPMST